MKKTLVAFLTVMVAWSVSAADSVKLEDRAQKLLAKFEAMQERGDKRVPEDLLKKAQGIILLDRTKAGFVFAFQGGSGISMARDPKTGKWGPIAFMKANEASIGFQIGGQQSFLVILAMTRDAAERLGQSTFDFSGEARGTAGDTSAGEEGKIATEEQALVVYGDRQGLYGGAALKGGAVSPDEEANRLYYGEWLGTKEILFEKKVRPTKAAIRFAEKIEQYSKKKG